MYFAETCKDNAGKRRSARAQLKQMHKHTVRVQDAHWAAQLVAAAGLDLPCPGVPGLTLSGR